jgi:hypothetical protein
MKEKPQQPRDGAGQFAKPKSATQHSVDAMRKQTADGKSSCLECGQRSDGRHDPNCKTGRKLQPPADPLAPQQF